MSEQLKLCKDCRHCNSFVFAFERCKAAPLSPLIDLISGVDINKGEYGFCFLERLHDGKCGEEARLFESCPPSTIEQIWNKLFRKDTSR